MQKTLSKGLKLTFTAIFRYCKEKTLYNILLSIKWGFETLLKTRGRPAPRQVYPLKRGTSYV